jgi:hypothetical protein
MTEKLQDDHQHPLLTDKEIAEAKSRARAKLSKEQKDAALKAVETAELDRLRFEEFQTVGGPENEMVNITIDLPTFAANLMTNWRAYWHGVTYTLPRHIANDLAYRMQCAWQHQYREIDGKKQAEFYQRKRETVLSPNGARNAPARLA